MHVPTDCYMKAVKHILWYMKATIGNGLMHIRLANFRYCLLTYSDADWASDPDENHFISGYCVYIGKNLVSLSRQKQNAVV